MAVASGEIERRSYFPSSEILIHRQADRLCVAAQFPGELLSGRLRRLSRVDPVGMVAAEQGRRNFLLWPNLVWYLLR